MLKSDLIWKDGHHIVSLKKQVAEQYGFVLCVYLKLYVYKCI